MKCQICHKDINSQDLFCGYCGTTARVMPTKEPTTKITYFFIILYAVFMFWAFFNGIFGDEPKEKNSPRPNTSDTYFRGYRCLTEDCEGHKSGFDWAEQNNIQYSSECTGKSDSFIEGCQAWVEN